MIIRSNLIKSGKEIIKDCIFLDQPAASRVCSSPQLLQPARFKQQQNIQSYRFNLPNPFSMIISLLVCKSITPSWKEVFSYTLISTQWFPTSSPLLSCSILYPESLPSRGGPSKPILLLFRFGSSTSWEI